MTEQHLNLVASVGGPVDKAGSVPHSDSSASPEEKPTTSGELNLRILQPLVKFLGEQHGEEILARIVTDAGLSMIDLKGRSCWASLEQVESFLAGAREMVADDEAFKQACIYKLKESYGPMRFLLRAASPKTLYEMATKTMNVISTISTADFEAESGTHIRLRYHSTRKESRLMCLSRQAQTGALATMWGLPHAHLTENACTSRGDDFCEYDLRLYAHRRWVPSFLGTALGGTGAGMLALVGMAALPAWLVLPLVGAAVGHIYELHRTNRANFAIGEEINDNLRQMVHENVGSRREILNLNKRQQEWNRLLEEQISGHTQTLEEVVSRIQGLSEERRSTIRGVSHDLNNPLTALIMQIDCLKTIHRDKLTGRMETIVNEQQETVERMRSLLGELMDLADSEGEFLRIKPQMLEVAPLVEQLRNRLRALAYGKTVQTSVFATREAPSSIHADRLLFDRVTDNLLTNATKYTETGSIIVELDGKPDFLTIKVSDTGRGIDDGDIRRIFKPHGSNPDTRKPDSHGVGLSVVVQLLSQIGGQLEVMSLPGKGTTFWAHFPIQISAPQGRDESDRRAGQRETSEELINKVVTIRRPQGISIK